MAKPNALLSTLYSVVAIYVEFFFGLVISILVARHLGPEQYGVYGYLMWISALLQSLVSGGVALGAIKFFAEARASLAKKKQDGVVVSSIVRLHNDLQFMLWKKITLFGVLCVGLVFTATQMAYTALSSSLLFITIISSLIKSYHMYYVSVMKGFEDFRSLAILSALITPFNLVLILFCFYTKQNITAYVWVYLAVSTMYLIISYFLIQKHIRKLKSKAKLKMNRNSQQEYTLKKATIRRHIQTASWISILSFVVLRQSELFFLNIFSTSDVMAFFNVGFTLASAAMTLVPGVYSAILMPLMARVNQGGGVQVEVQLKLSLRYMLQLIVALLFPICFFAEDIFNFLYGEKYMQAVFPFQVIIACVAFKTLVDCTNAYLWSKNQQSLLLKLIVVGCGVTILLDFYCIKNYNLLGALFAFSVSTIFFVSLNLALVIKKLKSKLEWFIYLKTIFCGFVAMMIVSPIGHYIHNIGGAILGCFLYLVFYVLMLLITFSLSTDDLTALRNFNQRFLKLSFFERMLHFIQNRIHPRFP